MQRHMKHCTVFGPGNLLAAEHRDVLSRLLDVELLPFSAGSFGNRHGRRSTYLFHKEDKELSGLRLAGVATVDVYVSGRFVEHFARLNHLGFASFQLSDDASFHAKTSALCWCAGTTSPGEKMTVSIRPSFPGTSGRVFVIRDVSFAIWRFALLEACDWNSTTLLIYNLLVRSRGSEAAADVFEFVDLAPPLQAR
jgi:hypothetical protein